MTRQKACLGTVGVCIARRVLVLLLLTMPIQALAQYAYTTNSPDTNTITITGYTGPGGEVLIPSTIGDKVVTSIGTEAFLSCSALRAVTIPDSVVSIGDWAFYDCSSLTNAIVGSGVASIGNGAFLACVNLLRVYFRGNAPSSVGLNVFDDDDNATVYCAFGTTGWPTIPNLWTGRPTASWSLPTCIVTFDSQGGTAASPATKIVTNGMVYGTMAATAWEVHTFDGWWTQAGGGTQVSSTTKVSAIINHTLYAKWLEAYSPAAHFTFTTNSGNIKIIKYIGPGGAVSIPETINGRSVNQIAGQAFASQSNVTSITVGRCVTNIGADAFFSCTNLASITVNTGNSFYSSLDGALLNKSQTLLILCPGGKAGSYSIPNSVTSIDDNAFYGCVRLSGVVIPYGIAAIGDYALSSCTSVTNVTVGSGVSRIGHAAFPASTNLTAITVVASNTTYSSLEGVLFNKNATALFQCPKGKAGSYTLPSSVAYIGDNAFCGCTLLKGVVIPASVTNIGWGAFSDCVGLTNVTIGSCVCRIEDWAFSGSGIHSLAIPASVNVIGEYVFERCAALAAITVDADNPFYSSVSGVLFNKNKSTLIQCPGGKTGSYLIPPSVIHIWDYAFSSCSNLTGVSIPISVTNIGKGAFAQCTGLNNVTIGVSVKHIADLAFWGCTNLASITIPTSVTSIGNRAFDSCVRLARVYFWGNAPSLGGPEVFYGVVRATAYYVFGTSNWPAVPGLWGGLPTSLWSTSNMVTFDSQGGAFPSPESMVVTNGSAYGILASTSRSGYTFDGWWTAAGGTGAQITPVTTVTITSSQTLYAKWLPNKYTVTFDAQGGTPASPASKVVTNGLPYGPLSLTVRTGYIFDGWWTEIEGNGMRVSPVISVAATMDYSLHAKWASDNFSPTSHFAYSKNNYEIYITNYVGPGGSVSIPPSINGDPVTRIYKSFAGRTNLSSLSIPGSVASIESGAFSGCTGLTNVLIGRGVTNIGSYAFSGCSRLLEVNVPDSVVNMEGSFRGCNSLHDIFVDFVNFAYSSINGVLFNKSQTLLIKCPEHSGGAYSIPLSVTSIGDNAFYECDFLESIFIHNNITNIGVSAFEGCSSRLQSVVIPDSVMSIGNNAFYDCNSLTNVEIGSGVTRIGTSVFKSSGRLENIVVNGSNSFYSSLNGILFNKAQTTLIYCPINNSKTMIPVGVTNINAYAFESSFFSELMIPDSVTSIGEGAFRYCLQLKTMAIPDSVTSMGDWTFDRCSSLTNVVIGNGVTNIGHYAFYDCWYLSNVVIGRCVERIGYYAFQNCPLINIVIPSSVKYIDSSAFTTGRYYDSLRNVYFMGNAPALSGGILSSASFARVHYVLGTTGFGSRYGGLSAGIWQSKVMFNAESGSVSFVSKTCNVGKAYGTLPMASRRDRFFTGWWTGTNGTGVRVYTNTIVPYLTTEHKLYARWSPGPMIGGDDHMSFTATNAIFNLPSGYERCSVEYATVLTNGTWKFMPLAVGEYFVTNGAVILDYSTNRPKAIYRAKFSP